MIHAELDASLPDHRVGTLELRSGNRSYRVTVDAALALAHSLLRAKRYKTAMRICAKVVGLNAHNPQAAILLACCEAGMKDYSACQKTLQAVFSNNNEALAEHFQAAFVYHNLGMDQDATRELIAITNEQPDLPMAWLLLGDHFNDFGRREKAALCWRLAIDRDKRQGVAALAAQQDVGRRKATRPHDASNSRQAAERKNVINPSFPQFPPVPGNAAAFPAVAHVTTQKGPGNARAHKKGWPTDCLARLRRNYRRIGVTKSHVRIGVEAPSDVQVFRSEILNRIQHQGEKHRNEAPS